MLSPDAGSVGVLCNSFGADGFATVFCAHVADGSEESVRAAALNAGSSATAVAEVSPAHQDKRALLDAAQTSRKLPLHFALLASAHSDSVDAPHPHPDANHAVETALQSLWPVTLLEAAHAASSQFHGQTSSLRDSAVMAAATAAEGGKARKLGKSLNPERRRAAVVPLLSKGRPTNQLLLHAPATSGTVPVLVASQNALLDVAQNVDARAGGLLHLRLPTNAPGAAAADDHQLQNSMDATVVAPGAGAFHCAAFRAAWATCCAWDAKLPCDPSCVAFCPEERAAGSAGTHEPRLDLPPRPADVDSAALEVCSFFLRFGVGTSHVPCRRSFHAVRSPRGLANLLVRPLLGHPRTQAQCLCQQSPRCRLHVATASMRRLELPTVVRQPRSQRRSAFDGMASSSFSNRWTHRATAEMLAGRTQRAAWNHTDTLFLRRQTSRIDDVVVVRATVRESVSRYTQWQRLGLNSGTHCAIL